MLTFKNQPRHGCIYEAVQVGGEGDFGPGPSSDPSNGGTPSVSTAPSTPSPLPGPTESGFPDPNPDETEPPSPPAKDSNSTFDVTNDPSNTETRETSSCFPASATVEMADGSKRAMADLRIGDAVRTKSSSLSDVFFFSHRTLANGDMHPYVELCSSSGAAVTLSEGHYVHVNGKLIAAGSVEVGDELTLANGSKSRVVSIRHVFMEGKYAPHTLHGDIVVNGVLVSTYTTAVHPRVAHHVLLTPLRWLYRIGMGRMLEGLLDSGAESFQRFIPMGRGEMQIVA